MNEFTERLKSFSNMTLTELKNCKVIEKKIGHPEADLQKMVVEYIRLKHPGILFFGLPAFNKISKFQGAINRDMGYKRGVPDLFIFEQKAYAVGLAIEFKSKTGQQTDDQIIWEFELCSRNWVYKVAKDYDTIIKEIDEYLKYR